jgi:uncharacterized protein YndB with AHSA1/START domain
MTEESQQVLITRVLNAPRELVFKAWTSRQNLERWYSPQGCEIKFKKMDFRPGGEFHSCIRTPEGHECWCRGVYEQIVAPERIVFSMAVSDQNGNLLEPTEAGMDADWPKETLVTVTFAEIGTDQTLLTLRQTVLESIAKRTGAYPSWLQMLDRLAGELASAGK